MPVPAVPTMPTPPRIARTPPHPTPLHPNLPVYGMCLMVPARPAPLQGSSGCTTCPRRWAGPAPPTAPQPPHKACGTPSRRETATAKTATREATTSPGARLAARGASAACPAPAAPSTSFSRWVATAHRRCSASSAAARRTVVVGPGEQQAGGRGRGRRTGGRGSMCWSQRRRPPWRLELLPHGKERDA